MKKQTSLDRYVQYQHNHQAAVDKAKGFAVYHCGKECFRNASAAICQQYIKNNALKNAAVGYAK